MFDGAHIHLLLNHVPILGPVFVIPLLLAGILKKDRSLQIAGLLFAVAVALVTIPAFVTGEEAEHAVEGRPGVSEVSIEEHEEGAEIAYYAMLMSGALALGTWLSARGNRQVSAPLAWITIVMMAITFVLMARTGNSGGKIRHTELGTASASVQSGGGEQDDD